MKSGMIAEAKANGGIPCGNASSFDAGFVEELDGAILMLHYDKLIQCNGEMHRTGRCVVRALDERGEAFAREVAEAHRAEGLVVLD